jgi:hypothetical protein
MFSRFQTGVPETVASGSGSTPLVLHRHAVPLWTRQIAAISSRPTMSSSATVGLPSRCVQADGTAQAVYAPSLSYSLACRSADSYAEPHVLPVSCIS